MSRVTYVKKAKASKRQRRCGKCGTQINPGDSYLWWARKTGPATGYKIFRCSKESCRPRPSETTANQYQSMWMAACEDFDTQSFESREDIAEAVRAVAETARDIGQTMTDNADNMESGFGHATYNSDELRERGDGWSSFADDLDSAADDIENMEDDDPECNECGMLESDGSHDDDQDPDYHEFDPSDDNLLESAREAAEDAMSNTPE